MGGSVFEALKAIDYLRLSTFPVYTIVEGYVASATTLLSIFGQRRLITKHSRMLIHQISNSLYGWLTMHELEDEYINAQELTDQLIQIYVDKTKMTRKQLEKFFKHDRWWSAQECLEKGLVDQII
jgi:ATP-dependent Clp protease, protease subunit